MAHFHWFSTNNELHNLLETLQCKVHAFKPFNTDSRRNGGGRGRWEGIWERDKDETVGVEEAEKDDGREIGEEVGGDEEVERE